MNENENWIGKKLSDKDNPSIEHTVVGQQDGVLYLDGNGRIEESHVSNVFNVNNHNSSNVDPDSFFNGSYGALVGAINSPNQSKSIGVQESSNTSVVQMTMGNEQALQAYQSGDYASHQPTTRPQPILNNHGIEPEPVQHFYGESMKDVVDEEEFNRVNNNMHNTKAPFKKRSMFDTMTLKKTTSVKIKLVLEEKIPKIEAIRSMNDLFDESIIDHLAHEITAKFLENPMLLEGLVAETLESIIYPNKKKTKKTATKKPVAKKTTVRKPAIKTNVKVPVKNSQSKNKNVLND
jgi:hypothetical protein